MGYFLDGLGSGILHVLRGEPEVIQAAWVTIQVSFWATLISSVAGLPVGYYLASARFRGRNLCIMLLQTLLGLPTVVIGLLVYGLLSRRGPLGFLDILFTPAAIIVGLVILAFPISATFSMAAVTSVDHRARETAITLGATPFQAAWKVVIEARFGIVASVLASFGRVASEVGIAMLLGGNIGSYTRTLTTTIALESTKGEFGFGIAIGVLLLAIVFGTNFTFRFLQKL